MESSLRMLHVAALPFPSPQGTQALLHAMLAALGSLGCDTHLLCYAHGAPGDGELPEPNARRSSARRARAHGSRPVGTAGSQPPGQLASEDGGVEPEFAHDARRPYRIHRIACRGFARSLRSGPSLDKLWLDAALLRSLSGLSARLRPDLIVAHHVEAAACGLALGLERLVFVAHTSLCEELPSYFPSWFAGAARRAGKLVDVQLVRRARGALAVSPLLAALLARDSGCAVRALPLPWPLPRPRSPGERERARARLGLAPRHELALYAGNLDAYQGLDELLPGLARVAARRPHFRWLVATASARGELERRLRACGLSERVRFIPLAGEAARRSAHAAADLALVPRRSVGGVPVKLLDALARETPAVASRRALSGLPLAPYCQMVDASPAAWEHALMAALEAPAERLRERARAGHAHLARAHAPAEFAAALAAYARGLRLASGAV